MGPGLDHGACFAKEKRSCLAGGLGATPLLSRRPAEAGETFFQAVYTLFSIPSMVEPLLSGIVLGLVPVTLAGLFVTAYLQYRRGDRVTNSL
jgi:cytochrome b6-f complex subunit 5